MVQMNAPKTTKTSGEYSKVELGDKVHFLLTCVQQLDIVFDVYQKGSCKSGTWEGHGKKDSVKLSIKENTPIYRKFAKVLKLNDNKTELFNLIADTLSGLFRNQQKVNNRLYYHSWSWFATLAALLQGGSRWQNLPACHGTVTIRIQEADDSHRKHRCCGCCPVCLLGSQM